MAVCPTNENLAKFNYLAARIFAQRVHARPQRHIFHDISNFDAKIHKFPILADALGMALRADSEKRHPASARGHPGVFPGDYLDVSGEFPISDEKS